MNDCRRARTRDSRGLFPLKILLFPQRILLFPHSQRLFPGSQQEFPHSRHLFPDSQQEFPDSRHLFPGSQHLLWHSSLVVRMRSAGGKGRAGDGGGF